MRLRPSGPPTLLASGPSAPIFDETTRAGLGADRAGILDPLLNDMLLDSIRSLFGQHGSEPSDNTAEPPPAGTDPLHLAACVLLLEVAHADGEFSASERAHLENVLERHFQLPPDSGRALLDLAEKERENSVDHFHFTSQLQHGYDIGQKMVLAEIMWGVVLADGEIAEHEHYLTRKISNLLGLEPGYLSAAKAAAARDPASGST